MGETTLEINLSALAHNYNYLKQRLRKDTLFLGVVKAFAYGSDMVAVARRLEELGVDYLAVAYVNEGVLLRDAGVRTPILVLHPQPSNFTELIDRCLEPSIYSKRVFDLFIERAEFKNQSDYPVHIKFNTGLNRLGFLPDDVGMIVRKINHQKAIKVKSLLSHLAASEDANEADFTQKQITIFKEIVVRMSDALGYQPIRHLLNTSGVINYPEAQFDMVRSGIGLYGFGNSTSVDNDLQPVVTLKTVISQLHRIAVNETVGYNRGYLAKTDRMTATLPLGHADGIGRQYGHGKAHVILHGKKAPIIGNVCMDMLMIDVTHIECQEGDVVTLFGEEQSADGFATSANTISYEILTAISQRVKRVVR